MTFAVHLLTPTCLRQRFIHGWLNCTKNTRVLGGTWCFICPKATKYRNELARSPRGKPGRELLKMFDYPQVSAKVKAAICPALLSIWTNTSSTYSPDSYASLRHVLGDVPHLDIDPVCSGHEARYGDRRAGQVGPGVPTSAIDLAPPLEGSR